MVIDPANAGFSRRRREEAGRISRGKAARMHCGVMIGGSRAEVYLGPFTGLAFHPPHQVAMAVRHALRCTAPTADTIKQGFDAATGKPPGERIGQFEALERRIAPWIAEFALTHPASWEIPRDSS